MDQDRSPTIRIDRAEASDTDGMAAVHVACWRSAYPGILPARVLRGLSAPPLAMMYARGLRHRACTRVARAQPGGAVIGFATASVAKAGALGAGEVETLYVLDDWRERGIGRALLRDVARDLAARGCGSVFLWVLSANPSRYFYTHLGGRIAETGTTEVGGETVARTAILWDPIALLLAEDAPA